jgi:hypothetical protein
VVAGQPARELVADFAAAGDDNSHQTSRAGRRAGVSAHPSHFERQVYYDWKQGTDRCSFPAASPTMPCDP